MVYFWGRVCIDPT